MRLWDAVTLRERAVLRGHTNAVLCVAFGPNTSELASASADKTVRLWNLTTKKERLSLKGHTDYVCVFLAQDDNDKTLFSGGEDGTLKLWSVGTGALEGSIRIRSVTSLRVARTALIATGMANGTTKLGRIRGNSALLQHSEKRKTQRKTVVPEGGAGCVLRRAFDEEPGTQAGGET